MFTDMALIKSVKARWVMLVFGSLVLVLGVFFAYYSNFARGVKIESNNPRIKVEKIEKRSISKLLSEWGFENDLSVVITEKAQQDGEIYEMLNGEYVVVSSLNYAKDGEQVNISLFLNSEFLAISDNEDRDASILIVQSLYNIFNPVPPNDPSVVQEEVSLLADKIKNGTFIIDVSIN